MPHFFRQAAAVAADIKLSHSVFALPFAVLGAALSLRAANRAPSWAEVGLVLSCMVLARTFAMAMNRWADAKLDAMNPRTAGRAIPSGRATSNFMLGTAVACGSSFLLCCGCFGLITGVTRASTDWDGTGWGRWGGGNWWPLLLGLPVLAVMGAYPFCKRFSASCHLVLGVSLGMSPLAAGLALEPDTLWSAPHWLLALMVVFWVAGFDVLYAMADLTSDQQTGVYSIPARCGAARAMLVARSLHVGAGLVLAVLVTGGLGAWGDTLDCGLNAGFAAAAILGWLLLVLEHVLVAANPRGLLHHAFFTVNGVFAVLLGLAGVVDLLRHGRA